MKKYRLKEEVKKYIKTESVRDSELTESHWSMSFGLGIEALEEVEERIEIIQLQCTDAKYVTEQILNDRVNLCEKALNGELLDIDSLNIKDFNNYLRGTKYYLASRPILNFVEKDLMEVFLLLKQYLKEKK